MADDVFKFTERVPLTEKSPTEEARARCWKDAESFLVARAHYSNAPINRPSAPAVETPVVKPGHEAEFGPGLAKLSLCLATLPISNVQLRPDATMVANKLDAFFVDAGRKNAVVKIDMFGTRFDGAKEMIEDYLNKRNLAHTQDKNNPFMIDVTIIK